MEETPPLHVERDSSTSCTRHVADASIFSASPSSSSPDVSHGSVPLEDDSAYTVDTKAMRYMPVSAFFKVGLHHLVTSFSAEEAETASSSPSSFSELASSSVHSYKNLGERFREASEQEEVSRVTDREAGGVGGVGAVGEVTRSARREDADAEARSLAGRKKPDYHPIQAAFFDFLRAVNWMSGEGELQGGRGATEEEKEAPAGDALSGILSMQQLALVDAGVYVRPTLSELLAELEDNQQMNKMKRRCEAIDAEVTRLLDSQRKTRDKADSGSQPTHVSPLSRSSAGSDASSLIRLAAISAEAARLREEKAQLRKHMHELRRFAGDIWFMEGLDPACDAVSLERFISLFCSDERAASQVRAAEKLFQLCQRATREGGDGARIDFETMLHELPTRAFEVMFVVREMKKKSRQSFRYSWI
ncbi:hypothetical protein BESB_013710 [Besnoitia besnoiti]|uniref:Uncharacterized protein n=1 Tax=Besnoitia besnoiti TaxID=94643 RepID=A0A2A9M483_BESBE|nr:hypothetical protein BESB_013710 [Besnoitia besnoiti]PFH32759.1 hypothetical protein BESB_013710 [Besnoitia besnoiti]